MPSSENDPRGAASDDAPGGRDALDLDATFTGTQTVREAHRFDEARLARWLEKALPGFTGPLEVSEFKGGQSCPTYRLASPSGRWVLRRKPPGHLLASAHAVDREYRVLSALQTIDFPSPRVYALCEDPEVLGTIFYVMECVEGRVLWDPLLGSLSPAERRALFESKLQVLATLHGADHEALGLGDFGRPGNYLSRQISRWGRQYLASESEKIPAMNRLLEWLPENVPDQERTAIIHGDYKLDNMIVHPTEPRILAVLDWEISTIGDPVADLTYHLGMRLGPGSVYGGLDDERLRALGIPTQQEWIDRYCELTGRDGIPHLQFYLAYNLFRSACIAQGIRGRVRDGTAASEHALAMSAGVRALAERALELARELGA